MFTSNSVLNNSTLVQLLSLCYQDKQIPKHLALSYSFNLVFSEINKFNPGLKISSHLLLAITKVYIRKIKYLLDDCMGLKLISAPKKERKNILQIRPFDLLKIDIDPKIDFLEEFTNSMFKEIEVRRNETELSFVNEIGDINISFNEPQEVSIKRRKIDDIIEYDSDSFRVKVRNVEKKRTDDKKVQINVNLPIEVLNFFKNYKRESIEVARDATLLDFEPNISEINIHEPNTFEQSYSGLDERAEDSFDIFSLEELDQQFVFNEKVKGQSKSDMAKSFFNLLNYCNNDKIFCKQNEPYGPIFCEMQ